LAVPTENPDATASGAPEVGDAGAASDSPLRPTALEIASGSVYGEHGASGTLRDRGDRALTPLAALGEVVKPALRRPPCLVSFSGGRDSSCVLATATQVAAREGLPPPVPVTVRVPNPLSAEESTWQEDVVRHLGLPDREVIDVGDRMDRLGPFSVRLLRRHGVLFPPNIFLQLPLLEAARGGTLLTGFGGDEVFATWRWAHYADLLARRRRPTPRDPIRFARAAAPAALRRRWERPRWRWGENLPWLRPEAAHAVTELAFAARADQPRSWSRWLHWVARRRTLATAQWSFSLLAADVGATVVHPFLDPLFLQALATAGGRLGLGERTNALREIFGALLPAPVLARTTKANYDSAFWGERSHEFAARWDGSGVDPELVDPEALKREWLEPIPKGGTAMLLHAAWLSQEPEGSVTEIAYDPARGRDQGSRGK